MASQPIFQFYAELCDYKPKMWRRFQVSKNITVARLGYIIMTMFEMQASHLFCIDVMYRDNFYRHLLKRCTKEEIENFFFLEKFDEIHRYEVQNEMTVDFQNNDSENAINTKLSQAVYTNGDEMKMLYDYGDDWEIKIALEQIIEDKELPGKELPRVLAGKGYGIIEDCGGVDGLTEIAKAFKNKKGSLYEDYCEWLGNDFDLIAFDLDDMNFRLKKVPRIYKDTYEYDFEPTKKSMDLLMRKYKKN